MDRRGVGLAQFWPTARLEYKRNSMQLSLMAFYAGPDQVMTVTSGIASIVGFLLIFWNKTRGLLFKLFRRSRAPHASTPEPDRAKTPS